MISRPNRKARRPAERTGTAKSELLLGPEPRPVTCRQALNPTGIPGFDYCINPYTGCGHACVYCYATFMKRYSGHEEPWGSFVDVKTNILDVLAKEVWRRKRGRVVIGSVCDAYQPAEAEFGLTRGIVETLARRRFPFRVLTKSALVARDIDVISRAQDSAVSITITTLNEAAARIFEPGAPPVRERLAALARLINAGIDTDVFCGPLLPYFSDSSRQIGALLSVLHQAGARSVMFDRLNYLKAKLPVILPLLRQHVPAAIPAFLGASENPRSYSRTLRQAVATAAAKSRVRVEVVF